MNSKRIIISFLIFMCINSCKNQENGLGFNQSISNEFVYITPDMYSESRDSLKIDIPLEFYIKKMEKVSDSIGITTSNKEEKLFKSKRFKINW